MVSKVRPRQGIAMWPVAAAHIAMSMLMSRTVESITHINEMIAIINAATGELLGSTAHSKV